MAQMRDAVHVQRFRIPAQPLDHDRAILEGATREIEVQKAKARTEKEGAAASTSHKRKQPASSLVFKGPVHRTEKKTETGLNWTD
jgi:hypothetical protein